MTSPATYRCTACGTALDRAADRHWISLSGVMIACDGPIVEVASIITIARDDRAGVTMPTALQPVGGDQFDAGGAGQVERGGDAIGGHIDNMGPDAATRDVNPTSAVLTAVDGAAVPA